MFENIPEELKSKNQWVLWKLECGKGNKKTKVPYKSLSQRANSTSPKDWISFHGAVTMYENNPDIFSGIGFVITEADNICCVDVDHVITDSGAYTLQASEMLETFNSYSELSQSGEGLHIFINAKKPGVKCKKNGIEIYSKSRFIAMTGNVLFDYPATIEERQAELDSVYLKYLNEPEELKGQTSTQRQNLNFSDTEIIDKARKAKNGEEFSRLYDGKISDAEDHSSLDLALCNMIAFYTQDFNQIDRIFTSSGLNREKWNRADYAKRTIEKAIQDLTHAYTGKPEKNLSQEYNQESNPISFKYYNFDKKGDPTSPKNVYENFVELLKFRDIKIRYNEMSKLLEIDTGKVSYSRDNAEEIYLQDFYNTFVHYNFKGFGKDLIKAMIVKNGDINRYNPVKDWIENAYKANIYYINKTGTTELDKLYDTLHTSIYFNPNFKKMLIKKWLISCVKAVFSDNGISAHGVLLLQGKQGLGKTTWFKNLCPNPDWFKDGATLDPSNKDSISGVIKYWLVELGEIESTLKKDLDHLKAFITKDFDELRRPYARAESKYPRRTIFSGSVNGMQFLKDDTGSRRFWTIPVIEIDYQTKIDVPRLWAEIKYLEQQGELWYLTKDEESLLSESNKMFEVKNYVDTLIEANFEWEKPCRYWLKSSDIFTLLGQGKELSSEKIGKALTKRGVNNKTKNGYKLYAVPKLKNWHGYWNYEESSGGQVW